MPVIDADGLAVDLIEKGEGPPVLLLHSAGMGAGQWRALIERLRTEYRLLAPNLRGYGRSAPWPKGTIADFGAEIDLVRRVCARLDGPVRLVGHSMGAYLALHLAAEAPERVASLVLIEPVALGVLRSEGEDRALAEVGAMVEACLAAFEHGNVNAAMTHFVDYWYGPGAWEAIPKAQRLFIYARAEKMHQEVRAVWRDSVALSAYRQVGRPAHVLVGAETTFAAKRMAALIAGALPAGSYEEMPGAGHMLPMSHPGELAARLRAIFHAEKNAG